MRSREGKREEKLPICSTAVCQAWIGVIPCLFNASNSDARTFTLYLMVPNKGHLWNQTHDNSLVAKIKATR